MNLLKKRRLEKSVLAVMLVICFLFNAIAPVTAKAVDLSGEGAAAENETESSARTASGSAISLKTEGISYYVDSKDGNDGNDGISSESPWKSLDKLNQTIFLPGDKILFKRGGVWTGQLRPQGSGTDGKPIIIASYGEGARPLIQGNNMVGDKGDDLENKIFNAAIFFYNQEYWEITELEVTNRIPGENPDDHIKKYGILIMGHDAGTLRHMYCRDLYVHDVVSHPIGNQAGIGRGGIAYIIRGNSVETRWDDIVVENNQIGPKINHYGLTFLSTWGSSLFPNESGITESGGGKRVNSSNIVIRNNYCVDVGNAAICPVAYENVLIENNVSDTCNSGPNGNVPIWWENGEYTVAQKNEVFNSGASPGKEDSQAFDGDVNAKLNYLQYNYTHDNPSGAYFECALGTNYTTYIRYNISQNDGAGVNSYGQGSFVTLGGYSGNSGSKMYVYNNTVYFGNYMGEPCKSNILHGWSKSDRLNPTNPENFQFKNNVIINDADSSGFSYYVENGVKVPYFVGKFSNNAYGGSNIEKIKPPTNPTDPMYRNETNSLVYGENGMTDKYFGLTDPGKAGSSGLDANGLGVRKDIRELAAGYQVKENSPLIGKGTVMPDNGGEDYFGNPVSVIGVPNIGADNSFAKLEDESIGENTTIIDFKDVDVTSGSTVPYENMQDHLNFGSGMWNVSNTADNGKELYANSLAQEQQVCKIALPEGKVLKGFKARSSGTANITVTNGSEETKVNVSNFKQPFKTEFVEATGSVYFIISAQKGTDDVKLDDLVLADLEQGIKNVALKKPATANGTSQRPADNANDGDESTIWVRNFDKDKTPPHWWQVDLQNEYDITGLEIAFEAAVGAQYNNWQYKIEGSATADFAAPIMLTDQTATTSRDKVQTLTSESNQKVRYVRVTLTQLGGDDPWPAIAEVKVFADTTSYKNVALKKTATQSGGYNNAGQAVDGIIATGNGGGNISLGAAPYTWEVDFGKMEKVAKTEIVFPFKDKNAPEGWIPNWSYKIEYYDGEQWKIVADYTQDPNTNPNKGTPIQYEKLEPDTLCSKMKVTITKAPTAQPGAWALLSEFRALQPLEAGGSDDAIEPGQIVNTNLAYGKPVVVSNDSKNGETVTDQNPETALDITGGTSIRIDLGKAYNMNEMELVYGNDTDAKAYKILSSVDGREWSEVKDSSQSTDKAALQKTALTAVGRYIKVEFYGSDQTLIECKVRGKEAERGKRKVMVIVPHQDDEVLLGGGIIKDATMSGDDIKIVIGTNGDYNGEASGKSRIAESISALTNLSVRVKDMLFLGYADGGGLANVQPVTDSRIYQMYMEKDENKIIPGRHTSKTYGRDNKQDYHFEYTGEHADYTRKNFLGDITHAIEEFNPTDIFVTSMYDMHYDHAYINLFVREAILNLQKEKEDFQPVLHDSVVHSVAGDSNAPNQPTKWPLIQEDATLPFSMPTGFEDKTTFDWNQRVSVTVPYQMRQSELFDYSLKNQTLKLYKSQYYNYIGAFSKNDEIFWDKTFDSISYDAKIAVSSEAANSSAANVADGIASGAIPSLSSLGGHPGFPHAEWVSSEKENAWVELTWNVEKVVDRVVLYDRPDPKQNITSGKLVFDDGSEIVIDKPLPETGRPMEITFEPKTVKSVRFVVTGVSAETTAAGLGEFEVYGITKELDKSELAKLIETAKAISNEGKLYSDESFNHLKAEIKKAEERYLTAVNEGNITYAISELQKAIDDLKPYVPEPDPEPTPEPGESGGGSMNTETETVKDPITGEVKEVTTKVTNTDTATKSKVVTKITKDAQGSAIGGSATVEVAASTKTQETSNVVLEVKLPEKILTKSIKDGAQQIYVDISPESLMKLVQDTEVKTLTVDVVIPKSIMNSSKAVIERINVKENVVTAAKDQKKDINFSVKNQDGKEYYSWNINGKELNESKVAAADLNLSMNVLPVNQINNINKMLQSKENRSSGLVFRFYQDGNLPAKANVKIYVGDQKGCESGKKLQLYYSNEKQKKLEEINNNMYTVDKDGYVTIAITHCSDYILLPEKDSSVSLLLDKVKVNKTLSIKKGKKASIKLVNTTGEKLKYSYTTSNSAIASVSKSGEVKAKKAGKAVISTKVTINGKTKVFKTNVTVK